MKKIYQSILLLILLSTSLISCTKDTFLTKSEIEEQNAINEVRKIVGNKGDVFIIGKASSSNIKSQSLTDTTKIKYLTLDELRELVKRMNSREKISGTIENKNKSESTIKSNSIKSFDEYEDDPRKAGYYHAEFPFYTGYYTNVNNAISFSGRYTMHLDFNTDMYGRVIGNPTISFTGIGLVTFSQVNASNITFDPKTGNNYFTITGLSAFGFQVGGGTLGWSTRSNYLFTVNMDDANTKNAVYVEQN